jgi:hypothetical protein
VEVFIIEVGVRNKFFGHIEEIRTDQLMAQIKMTVDG